MAEASKKPCKVLTFQAKGEKDSQIVCNLFLNEKKDKKGLYLSGKVMGDDTQQFFVNFIQDGVLLTKRDSEGEICKLNWRMSAKEKDYLIGTDEEGNRWFVHGITPKEEGEGASKPQGSFQKKPAFQAQGRSASSPAPSKAPAASSGSTFKGFQKKK